MVDVLQTSDNGAAARQTASRPALPLLCLSLQRLQKDEALPYYGLATPTAVVVAERVSDHSIGEEEAEETSKDRGGGAPRDNRENGRTEEEEDPTNYLTIPSGLATNEPFRNIFTSGTFLERSLSLFVFLVAAFIIVLSLSHQPDGLTKKKAFISNDIKAMSGEQWHVVLLVHVLSSCVMLLSLPVLIIPYFLKKQRSWFDYCFWTYVISALPGIITCLPLSLVARPHNFATVTAYFIGTLFWIVPLPFIVWYRAFKPNQQQLYIWLLRQFVFTWAFPVMKNLLIHAALFAQEDEVDGRFRGVEEMYGTTVWITNFLVIILGEWLLIPLFVSRYLNPRKRGKRESREQALDSLQSVPSLRKPGSSEDVFTAKQRMGFQGHRPFHKR